MIAVLFCFWDGVSRRGDAGRFAADAGSYQTGFYDTRKENDGEGRSVLGKRNEVRSE